MPYSLRHGLHLPLRLPLTAQLPWLIHCARLCVFFWVPSRLMKVVLCHLCPSAAVSADLPRESDCQDFREPLELACGAVDGFRV